MQKVPYNNVYIYNRVSTPKQSDTGLPKQHEECTNYLQKQKITKYEEYVDIKSSYKNSNALYNLNRLIRKIQKNDLIVIARISRLGRNVLQVISALEKVKRKGALIYSVYENLFWNKNKYDNTKFQNIVIKAREKSDILSIKSHDTYNYITSNNGYYGKPAYGFSVGRNENNIPILVPNDQEIRIINFIKDQYENNKMTFFNIANTLNEKGTNKRGYEWNVLNVKRVYQYNVIDMDSSMNSVYQPDKKVLTRSNSGSLLHRSNSGSFMHRSGSGTSLHKIGSSSTIHRTSSLSGFNSYKKQHIPESPTQTYKSKFKTYYHEESDEEETIKNKIKNMDISKSNNYTCNIN